MGFRPTLWKIVSQSTSSNGLAAIVSTLASFMYLLGPPVAAFGVFHIHLSVTPFQESR